MSRHHGETTHNEKAEQQGTGMILLLGLHRGALLTAMVWLLSLLVLAINRRQEPEVPLLKFSSDFFCSDPLGAALPTLLYATPTIGLLERNRHRNHLSAPDPLVCLNLIDPA